MEITTLGVAIDPTLAKSGAAESVKAAENMAAGMNSAAIRAERAQKGVGAAAQDMAAKVADGSSKSTQAVERLAGAGAWNRLRANMRGALANFNVSGFGRGILDLGNSFGMMNNSVGRAVNQLTSMGAVMGRLPGIAGPLVAVIGALVAGVAALAAAWTVTLSAVNTAGMFESMENQLAVLIGSFEGARERVTMLRSLAVETPFELPGLIEANRLLETFSEGAYASREAMRTIGDAASAVGQPIKDVAFWIGRLYAGLKGGTAVGEATMRLSEMAIITPRLKNQIEELTKTNEGGKRFAEIWGLAESGMKRFDGAMKLQSRSWEGLKSSLGDVRTELEATFGTPIKDALKPLLASVTTALSQMVPLAQQAGEAVAGRITGLIAMIQSGEFWTAWARNIWATFVDLGLSAIEQITAGFGVVGEYLLARATDFIEYLAIATTPAFWEQIGTTLEGVGIDFENALRSAAENFINLIRDAAPDWLVTDRTRADFGRIAKPTIPQAPLAAPDIANFNNSGDSISKMYERNLAGMKGLLSGTREAWQQWRDDYNNDKLVPIADKLRGDFSKNDSMLPKKGGSGGESSGLESSISKAKGGISELEALAKRVIDSTRTPMEAYQKTMADLQTLQARGMIDAKTYAAAAAQAAEQYENAVTQAAETAKRKAFEQMTPLQQLLSQWRDLGTAMRESSREIAGSISSNMTDALTDMITGAASVSDAFSRMARSIIADLVRMAAQMLINWAIQKAIGMAVGAISGGASGAATGAATTAAVHHTGGVVGEGRNFRTVPASTFRNAPRFQHGGRVGSGETPAIMEPGETVLTRDQASDIKSRLGDGKAKETPKEQPVTILNVVDRSLIEQHIAANPSIILNAIGRNASQVRRSLRL